MKLYDIHISYNKKMRCLICNAKLSNLMVQMFTCRCEGIFCRKHMFEHNCQYDYVKDGREYLKQKMPLVKPEKISKL